MKQSVVSSEEMLRVLTKGMVTIPKSWRDELGIKEGKFIRAKKVANQIIIKGADKPAPYRIYSREELKQFLQDDQL